MMFGVTFRMTITSDGLSGVSLTILSIVEMVEGVGYECCSQGLDVAFKDNGTLCTFVGSNAG